MAAVAPETSPLLLRPFQCTGCLPLSQCQGSRNAPPWRPHGSHRHAWAQTPSPRPRRGPRGLRQTAPSSGNQGPGRSHPANCKLQTADRHPQGIRGLGGQGLASPQAEGLARLGQPGADPLLCGLRHPGGLALPPRSCHAHSHPGWARLRQLPGACAHPPCVKEKVPPPSPLSPPGGQSVWLAPPSATRSPP